MIGISHTYPTSVKAEDFNLLYILGIHLRFSIKYFASKNKLENIKPVHRILASVPPNLGYASWSSWLHIESMEAVSDEDRTESQTQSRPPSLCHFAMLQTLE